MSEHAPRETITGCAIRRSGWWGMACWNALSPAQQDRLITVGNLPIGYRPEGTGCDRGAEVAIECDDDTAPGPRFYCLRCAVRYLDALHRLREALRV